MLPRRVVPCRLVQLATLHADHSAFSRAKLAGPFEFSVRHYAGEVLYHAEGFLDKNRDSVGEACRDLLAKSSVPLVSSRLLRLNGGSSLLLSSFRQAFRAEAPRDRSIDRSLRVKRQVGSVARFVLPLPRMCLDT